MKSSNSSHQEPSEQIDEIIEDLRIQMVVVQNYGNTTLSRTQSPDDDDYEKAKQALLQLIDRKCKEARVDERNKCINLLREG